MAHFLWAGVRSEKKFHLCKMSEITFPKAMGGWGLLDIRTFSYALLSKTMWRMLTGCGIWKNIMKDKYIKGHSLASFIYGPFPQHRRSSKIWRSITKTHEVIKLYMVWKFGNGGMIPISCKHIMGVQAVFSIEEGFIHRLRHRGFIVLADIISNWIICAPVWKSFETLGLRDCDKDAWLEYISSLQATGLFFDSEGDKIVWGGAVKGSNIDVRDLYQRLKEDDHSTVDIPGFTKVWRWKIPHKIVLFNWLLGKEKILTWEKLQRKGRQGPGRCYLCKSALETTSHIFFECEVSMEMWEMFSNLIGIERWRPLNKNHAYEFWATKDKGYTTLPYYVCWELWCTRNNILFNEAVYDTTRIYTHVMEWLHMNPAPAHICKDLSIRIRPHCIQLPALFFDRAQQEGKCGCGAWINLNGEERYHIIWNEGFGSNNKAEIMALWSGILVAHHLNIPCIDIYGDSRIVIDGISGIATLNGSNLCGWIDCIRYILSTFQRATLHHIYRDLNGRADRLSKKGLDQSFGFISVIFYRNNREVDSYRHNL